MASSFLLSLLFVPWLWFDNASVILNVMGAVGGALGSVAGIMFADYYVVHHRHYDIDSFYVSDSSYAYKHGWNFRAIGTFI